MDHERRRSGDLRRVRERESEPRATRGSRRSSSSASFAGFAVGKKEDKLGIRASSTTELILDGVEVPAENVLGPVGQGYKIAIETLNEGRIGIGAQMIGVAQGALAAATTYVKERTAVRQAARRVPGHPVPARAGAHGAEAARLMVYNAARLKDAGHDIAMRRRDGEALLDRRSPSA